MAQRRMFSLQIVDTDAFMDMPLSSQALYFQLGMRADDDGFVSNPKRVQKLLGASDDDMRILIGKRFILAFDSGVIVIKHWKISNYIQKDRYRPTLYKEEKATLYLKPDGAYTDHWVEGAEPCNAKALPEPAKEPEEVSEDLVSNLDTDWIHRLGKDRLGKVNNYISGDGDIGAGAESEVIDYVEGRNQDPRAYFGVTDELISEAHLLTFAIFKRFAARKLTQTDVANVLFATMTQTREGDDVRAELSQDKKDLLMYAFETATNANKPGDWNYINGVLARLSQRGITTLKDAEEYDYERTKK